jgi:hypothetical protein
VKIHSLARFLFRLMALMLFLHGLIHLMGVSVYWQLTEIEGLVYKTTLMNGHWDVGAVGTRVLGGLWLVSAIGFVAASIGLIANRLWLIPVLFPTTLLSLALTSLDWTTAFAGLVVDLAILTILWWARDTQELQGWQREAQPPAPMRGF